MDERRRTERGDGSGDVGVAVRTAEGVRTPGQIVRVSHERLTVAFPAMAAPEVEPRSLVTLLFRTIRGGELTATGRLLDEGEELDGQRLFAFVFESATLQEEGSTAATPPEGDNRREAYRVKLDPLAVGVTMRPCGDPSGSVLRQLMNLRAQGEALAVKGWVYDISCEGICVLLDECETQAFEPGDHLDLTLTLPGSSDPLRVGVHVKHRVGVRYGLSFGVSSTAQFERMQERVLEFVIREQQRALRSRTV